MKRIRETASIDRVTWANTKIKPVEMIIGSESRGPIVRIVFCRGYSQSHLRKIRREQFHRNQAPLKGFDGGIELVHEFDGIYSMQAGAI